MVSKDIWGSINQYKQSLWKAQNKADFEAALGELRNYTKEVKKTLTKEDFEFLCKNVKEQVEGITAKKEEWFKKNSGQHPVINKTSYIFREDEGKAFVKLCTALADYLARH